MNKVFSGSVAVLMLILLWVFLTPLPVDAQGKGGFPVEPFRPYLIETEITLNGEQDVLAFGPASFQASLGLIKNPPIILVEPDAKEITITSNIQKEQKAGRVAFVTYKSKKQPSFSTYKLGTKAQGLRFTRAKSRTFKIKERDRGSFLLVVMYLRDNDKQSHYHQLTYYSATEPEIDDVAAALFYIRPKSCKADDKGPDCLPVGLQCPHISYRAFIEKLYATVGFDTCNPSDPSFAERSKYWRHVRGVDDAAEAAILACKIDTLRNTPAFFAPEFHYSYNEEVYRITALDAFMGMKGRDEPVPDYVPSKKTYYVDVKDSAVTSGFLDTPASKLLRDRKFDPFGPATTCFVDELVKRY